MGGKVVEDYAVVLKELWSARTFFRPSDFKVLLNCFSPITPTYPFFRR